MKGGYKQTPAEGLRPMFLYRIGFLMGWRMLRPSSSLMLVSAPTSLHDTFGIVANLKEKKKRREGYVNITSEESGEVREEWYPSRLEDG